MQPHIQQKFSGDIWRLEIDETTATLLLEIRNEAAKQVSFASVNLQNGKVNFSDYSTPERWLTGMEAAHNGVLLLHNYASASAPVHKAVIAVDEVTGETLWSNYTLAFDHLSVNGPVVYSTQLLPKRLYLADILTGAMGRPYNPVADIELRRQITVPEMISTADILDMDLPVEPYGGIVHYVEHNNFRILSLHSLDGGMLKQHLYILNDAGIVYEDLLNTDIQKLQPEAFVLHKNWLICLKNKTDLMVFEL